MNRTIQLEDMRLFAKVAEHRSFSAAARELGIPKQTISRRIALLERALGLQLIHRTTRRLQLSSAGAAYADRCAELVRFAEDANRAVSDAHEEPAGTLRVTADPLFGESFLAALLVEYAKRWPAVRLDVVLTRRRVDLIEESFDVAFRVGSVDDAALSGIELGPARVRYCASPGYVAARGVPSAPDELGQHDCLVVGSTEATRWPIASNKGPRLQPIIGKHVFSSFSLCRDAALAGLGIALFPEFACAADLKRKRLVPVLDGAIVEVGSVWLVYPARRFLPARARAFVDMARERFERTAPWLPSP
jgi:DNA-binding transcriptional LysR family regulator